MKTPDPRAQQTRRALLQAFRELLLQGGPLEDIHAAQVAARAGVGRSTLYEHFAGVDGLLTASLATLFAVLVDTLSAADDTSALQRLLEHFWQQRALARTLFSGPLRQRSIAVLVRSVETKLKSLGLGRRGQLVLPTRLAAVQLAEILLAPIIAWLGGESRCTPEVLASAVSRVAQAALQAMRSRVTARS